MKFTSPQTKLNFSHFTPHIICFGNITITCSHTSSSKINYIITRIIQRVYQFYSIIVWNCFIVVSSSIITDCPINIKTISLHVFLNLFIIGISLSYTFLTPSPSIVERILICLTSSSLCSIDEAWSVPN